MSKVASCKLIPHEWTTTRMNASTAHTLPRLLVARRTGMECDVSIAKPFRLSDDGGFYRNSPLLPKRRKTIAHFLRLPCSVTIEFIQWILAIRSIINHKGNTVPLDCVDRSKRFPGGFPEKPMAFVI